VRSYRARIEELDRTWKVGELARATGLTIRALHHYDDIGLLVPGRTESGHRVYSHADVERLYRVLALRGVGMALDEIGAALDDDGVSLMDTVRRHVAAVERDWGPGGHPARGGAGYEGRRCPATIGASS